jgi:hypothetical protein
VEAVGRYLRKGRLFVLAGLAALGALSAIALADNTVADGDGDVPVSAQTLAFGNVNCGQGTNDTALVAIARNGSATGTNTFKNSASIGITVVGTTGDVSASDPASSITLPSNWGSLANNTMSSAVSSTVTVDSSTAGAGNGSVTYRATGLNSSNATITRDTTMAVTWNTVGCAPADSTAPSITPNITGTVGNNGWYTSDVGLTWTVTDPDSTITSTTGCGPVSITADQVSTDYTCSATSAGGTDSKTVSIKRDATAPTYGCGSADTSWHAANVSIACTADGAISGLLDSGDASFNLTTTVADGAADSNASTGSNVIEDNAGNTATAGPIAGNKVDREDPVVTCDTPAPQFTLGQSPADVTGTATDNSGSGLATSPTPSGAADTSAIGGGSVNLGATDNVGNAGSASCSYSVIYTWTGFFRPIDNLPVLNSVKAGSSVPVKFSLGGDQGLAIFASGYPKSQEMTCSSTADVDGVEETVTAGASSLTYDSLAQQYVYVWKTEKAWAGKCRQLVVKLTDDTYHRANFKLTK